MTASSMEVGQPRRAVVFAYHNVGARCLRVLKARGVQIELVVTHHDNPAETIWFESVREVADGFGIPWIAPDNASDADLAARIAAIRPDFIFSFYYRHMIPERILKLATKGAFNMHGSLLPKYRGRVPVNWAVLHGESETGATLHEMVAQPDAGAIVAQVAVPILPDDTAHEVFGKVTVAAEQALWRVLPSLLAGTAARLPNDLARGSYFSGRKPEDGRIDWMQSAQQIYNLIRAVAPPYPGAFFNLGERRLVVARARPLCESEKAALRDAPSTLPPGLHVVDNMAFVRCGDGQALRVLELLEHGRPLDAMALAELCEA